MEGSEIKRPGFRYGDEYEGPSEATLPPEMEERVRARELQRPVLMRRRAITNQNARFRYMIERGQRLIDTPIDEIKRSEGAVMEPPKPRGYDLDFWS